MLHVGKTNQKGLIELIEVYEKRLKEYVKFEKIEILELAKGKNTTPFLLAGMEGKQIISKILPTDYVCLLDEKGTELTSKLFADFLQKKMLMSIKRLIFVVGGSYGFSNEVYTMANERISLSKMTFTHQMVRLFFTEQLYRGFSIINNKPYHHE